MKINWFPGHMTKALRMMQEEVKNCDFAVYVLDARAPFACLNPKIEDITKERPIIYVLNKSDLADDNKTKAYQKKLTGVKSECLVMNSTQSGASREIEKVVKSLLSEKIEKYRLKNIKPVLRGMIVGVPNSGKSTLVNNLCGKTRAIVGNKPGVTKGKQWVRVGDNLEIMDSPGTLWPSLSDEKNAKYLAYIGSIKDEVLDKNELALDFVKDISSLYPNAFLTKYGIETIDLSPIEILDKIGTIRKFLVRGGEIDYDRTCNSVLDDFRKGRLGKITLN